MRKIDVEILQTLLHDIVSNSVSDRRDRERLLKFISEMLMIAVEDKAK